MPPDYTFFDSLIGQNRSFSVYRMPGSASIAFIMQEEGAPEQLFNLSKLNGKEGFVIAPFVESQDSPIVLLHPDIILEGEQAIFDFLTKTDKTFQAKKRPIPLHQIPESDSFQAYQKAFELFQDAIRSNVCEKIVLSRTFDRKRPEHFSAGKTFKSACEAYPEAFVYLCHNPLTGTWLGSSPELLLSGSKTDWQTVALAGTLKIAGENGTDRWDQKNIREQQIVADYLDKQLKLNKLTYTKNGPYSSKAGRLLHLKTDFSFQMNDTGKIGDLLESLHPTSAVCGYPKEESYRLIMEKEGYDRTYYSGFIGQLSTKGSTDLFVNLRCMKINPDRLTLFAGGGLLISSDLETEWEETEEKLQTMLSLIEF